MQDLLYHLVMLHTLYQVIAVEVEGERDPSQRRRPPHDRVGVFQSLLDAVGRVDAGSESQELPK